MEFSIYQMPVGSVKPDSEKTKNGWLDPLVVGPTNSHRRSFVLLHGRGSNAFSFGSALLAMKLPSSSLTLPEVFLETRFIFPTSKLGRAVALNRARVAQWFDVFSLEEPDERQAVQHEGLRESAQFVHSIILQEAELVGLENVVLGGLSQGCAMGLHVLMSFESKTGARLGGFFGMSGWLPFTKQLAAIPEGKDPVLADRTEGIDEDENDNPFGDEEHDDDPLGNQRPTKDADIDLRARAIRFVRQEVMDFPDTNAQSINASAVPIFLGHGELDEKVSVKLGRRTADIMKKLGWNITWKSYDDLAHWYSPQELEDIVGFVQGLGREEEASQSTEMYDGLNLCTKCVPLTTDVELQPLALE